jgi:2,4-diketo-3-deoxy-L-fuconate hydrolase
MRLVRRGRTWAEKPAAFADDSHYIGLSDVVEDFDEQFFSTSGIDRIRPLVADRVPRGIDCLELQWQPIVEPR